MKKAIYLVTLISLLSCTNDTNDTPDYIIDAVPSSTTVEVDEVFTVTITSPEDMISYGYSLENFQHNTALYNISNYGKSATQTHAFENVGNQTIYFMAVKAGDIQSKIKPVTLNVTHENAVKITGMKLTSFKGMGGTYDEEYPNNDQDRLADIRIYFVKDNLSIAYDSTWFKSPVRENQNDLTWSFQNDNLYIDPKIGLFLHIYDWDGVYAPNSADMIQYVYDLPKIDLQDYLTTKPTSIDISDSNEGYAYTLYLEWPK